jgi:hypothetical protein
MRQDVDLCITPLNQLTIKPNFAIAIFITASHRNILLLCFVG